VLVLTRKVGEQLFIGGDLMVQVLGTSGGRVRLGIEAPRSVPVRRSELVARAKSMPRQRIAAAAHR
jgi:carbon storage regulator